VKLGITHFGYFSKYDTRLPTAISTESSRRDLSDNVAKQKSILKNNPNTYYPRFSLTAKTGTAFPKKRVFCFYYVAAYFSAAGTA